MSIRGKGKVLGCIDHENIYKRYKQGEKMDHLAKCYGVSPGIIRRICDSIGNASSSPSAPEIGALPLTSLQG